MGNRLRSKETVLSDDQRNPEYLGRYIERLIYQVLGRVGQLTEGWRPQFKSGSVRVRENSFAWDVTEDSPIFDLLVVLIEFLGNKGIGSSPVANQDALKRWIAKNGVTDAELVRARLKDVRRQVKLLLTPVGQELEGARNMRDGVNRCYDLMLHLRAFATDSCSHRWESISDDPQIHAEVCARCGLTNTESA